MFIDNLPLSMNPKELFLLFTKFEVVKDVFIPGKIKKARKSKVWIRKICPPAAKVAIQKEDGLW